MLFWAKNGFAVKSDYDRVFFLCFFFEMMVSLPDAIADGGG